MHNQGAQARYHELGVIPCAATKPTKAINTPVSGYNVKDVVRLKAKQQILSHHSLCLSVRRA